MSFCLKMVRLVRRIVINELCLLKFKILLEVISDLVLIVVAFLKILYEKLTQISKNIERRNKIRKN